MILNNTRLHNKLISEIRIINQYNKLILEVDKCIIKINFGHDLDRTITNDAYYWTILLKLMLRTKETINKYNEH